MKWLFFIIGIFIVTNLNLAAQSNNDPSRSTYRYPYLELESIMKEKNETKLPIFVYGSLMDRDSALRSISEATWASKMEGIAFSLKRIFNRDIPITLSSKYGLPVDPRARAMLNVELTNNPHDIVNGFLFSISIDEIDKLRQREGGYDLIPIDFMRWEDFLGEKKGINMMKAYTFSAPKESHYVDTTILPRPGYYELARDAMEEKGPLFQALWYLTTFMADGATSIKEWEENIQKKLPQTQAYTQLPHQ